jgi:hypothetical protein
MMHTERAMADRVFVLGSGFSASMGVPTLEDLFPKIIEHGERPGENDIEGVRRGLEMLYPTFLPNETYPPFEEFLSLVRAAQGFAEEAPFPGGFWEDIERSALRLLTDYMGTITRVAESATLLNAFFDRLRTGDVVITFNWDSLIERASRHASRETRNLSLTGRTTCGLGLLKLHGSLSWARVPEQFQHANPHSVSWLSDQERICRTRDHTYYDLWDSLDIPPYIIPPLFGKEIDDSEFMRQLWSEAFSSLVEAEEITVIGYSLPDYDFLARTLLRSAIRAREGRGRTGYRVVDPNADIERRYAEKVSQNLDFVCARFDNPLLPR